MNFIIAIKYLLAHYDDIVAAVALAERMFPESSSGAKKLQWVHDELASNSDALAAVGAGNYEALWPYVVKVVNLVVKYALNAKKAA